MMRLYDFSISNIYQHSKIIRYQDFCKRIINELFDYLVELYNKWNFNISAYYNSLGPLDKRFGHYLYEMQKIYTKEKASTKAIVKDYIAGMTDDYATRCMQEISLPEELSFDRPLILPNDSLKHDE